MTRAKLIKKNSGSVQSPAPESRLHGKKANEIVREWIEQSRQGRPSAREAFAALFAKPRIGQPA